MLDMIHTLSISELKMFLENYIMDIDKIHQPINVTYADTILQRIHYGDSELINQLKFYPYFTNYYCCLIYNYWIHRI